MHAVFFSSFATASYIFVIETYSGGIRGEGRGALQGRQFLSQMYFYYTNGGAHIYLAPGRQYPLRWKHISTYFVLIKN